MAQHVLTEEEIENRARLKFKYRDPANVPVVKNGAYKGRANAARTKQGVQGNGHRRRSYFTHIVGGK